MVKSRLIIVLALVLIFIASSLSYGYLKVRESLARATYIHDQAIPELRSYEQMRFGVLRVVSSTSELIVVSLSVDGNTEVNTLESEMGELALIWEGREVFIQAYVNAMVLSKLNHEQHRYHEIVKEKYDRLVSGSELIITLLDKKDYAAIGRAKESFEALETEALSAIDEFLARAHIRSNQDANLLISAIERLGDDIILLSFLAFSLLLGYSVYVFRLLDREANEKKRAEELSKKLSHEIEERTRT